MLIKVGEKIINGNMIKRNEDFKNKRIKYFYDMIFNIFIIYDYELMMFLVLIYYVLFLF